MEPGGVTFSSQMRIRDSCCSIKAWRGEEGGVTLGAVLTAIPLLVDMEQLLMLDYSLKAGIDLHLHLYSSTGLLILAMMDVVPLAGQLFCFGKVCLWGNIPCLPTETKCELFNDLWQSQTNMQTEEVAKRNWMTDAQMKAWA